MNSAEITQRLNRNAAALDEADANLDVCQKTIDTIEAEIIEPARKEIRKILEEVNELSEDSKKLLLSMFDQNDQAAFSMQVEYLLPAQLKVRNSLVPYMAVIDTTMQVIERIRALIQTKREEINHNRAEILKLMEIAKLLPSPADDDRTSLADEAED